MFGSSTNIRDDLCLSCAPFSREGIAFKICPKQSTPTSMDVLKRENSFLDRESPSVLPSQAFVGTELVAFFSKLRPVLLTKVAYYSSCLLSAERTTIIGAGPKVCAYSTVLFKCIESSESCPFAIFTKKNEFCFFFNTNCSQQAELQQVLRWELELLDAASLHFITEQIITTWHEYGSFELKF